jgi:hypothetical protein
MNFLLLIPALYRAWQVNGIIRNPAKWKSGGELINAVAALVTALISVAVFANPHLASYFTIDVITAIIAFVVQGLILINIVIARITTRKEMGIDVLLSKTPEPEPPGRRIEDVEVIPPPEPGRWAEDIPIEKRTDCQENLGSPGRLEQRNRKSDSQGKDVV